MTKPITWKDAVACLEKYHERKGFTNLANSIDTFMTNSLTPASFSIEKEEWDSALYIYGDMAPRKAREIWKIFVSMGFITKFNERYYLMVDDIRAQYDNPTYIRATRQRENAERIRKEEISKKLSNDAEA